MTDPKSTVLHISIALDDEEMEWLQTRAAQDESTIGDFITDAIRRKRQAEARAAYLDESDLDELTLEDIKTAIREQRGPKPKSRTQRIG